MKKKIACILLTAGMAAQVLAGCGNSAGGEAAANETATTQLPEATDAAAETGAAAEDAAAAETGTAGEASGDSAAAQTGDAGAAASGDSAAAPTGEASTLADVLVEGPHEMTTVIEGCDTFTQIVDKLEAGKAYANATIGGTDVLVVASGAYDWEPDVKAAIDGELFCYTADGSIAYLGFVSCGGTAYPLAVKDGSLYTGGNHFMKKQTVKDGALALGEAAWVIYDSNGNGTYYYSTQDDGSADAAVPSEEAEASLTRMYDELETAEILSFSVVSK